jgi:ABC-type phosphate/phosphonate transport system permease subunit
VSLTPGGFIGPLADFAAAFVRGWLGRLARTIVAAIVATAIGMSIAIIVSAMPAPQ